MARTITPDCTGPDTMAQKMFWLSVGVVLCVAFCVFVGLIGPPSVTDGLDQLL